MVRPLLSYTALPLLARCALIDLELLEGEHTACSPDYHRVSTVDALNGDLNQGAGGKWIWLCAKWGITENPITDVIVIAENGSDEYCGAQDSTWGRVKQYQGSNGDVNHGAGGKYIYLCWKKGWKSKEKGPIVDLKLNEDGECWGGMDRIDTRKDSNGDLNQGAGGKYIYLCYQRGCTATTVQGQWQTHGGQIIKSTTESWTVEVRHGGSYTHSEDWKESMTVKVSRGFEFEDGAGKKSGSKEISGTVAHETSNTFSESWSIDKTETYSVTYPPEDVMKQPWQFVFSGNDNCGNTVDTAVQSLAITEGAWRPPCCLPGYAIDKYYKVCHSREVMTYDGEAKYGCQVAGSETTTTIPQPVRFTWYGPQKNSYSGADCDFIAHSPYKQLESCQNWCDAQPTCSAVNWNQVSGDCVLRSCLGDARRHPSGGAGDYVSYYSDKQLALQNLTELATGTCSDLCADGGHGAMGSISGTAPACAGQCSDCGSGYCYQVEMGSVSDYGKGCWTGNKVCCCSQAPSDETLV